MHEAIHGRPSGNLHSCFHTLSCSISLFHCYFVHGEYIYDPYNDQFGPESMHLWSKEFQGHQRQNLRNKIVCGTKIRTDLGERKI